MNKNYFNSNDPERLKNFGNEADFIINGLIHDDKFRYDFFYGKRVDKCNMARLRRKIINDIKNQYNVIISEDTFNYIVYLTLWAGGTWSTLDSYSKKSTFHSWLRKVAKNAVMKYLEDEHWIPEGRSSVGNTRLALLSQPESVCKLVIDELMAGSKYYNLLTDIYVKRLPAQAIIKKMDIKQNEFDEVKKKAECKLKDALLRCDYNFADYVLHTKSKRVVKVSSEFVADIAEWCKTRTGVNPLSDVFGTNLSDDEIRVRTVEFLYDFTAKLKWSDEDRYIWRQRFVENASPVELAREIGRSRGWLDTRFSRLNKMFDKAIKEWWALNAA